MAAPVLFRQLIVLLTTVDKALDVPSVAVALTAKYQVPCPRF
jgi:hypothetical protein